MLQMFVLLGDGRTFAGDADEKVLHQAVRDPKARFWLDIEKPTDEMYAVLDDVFGFHPLAIEDTISYQQRPKIEHYDHISPADVHGYYYMVLHGPDLTSFRENLRTKELDMFFSDRYLVTIHDEQMMSVDTLRRRAQGDPARTLHAGVDVLLYQLLDQLVDHYMPILEHLQERLEELEDAAINAPKMDVLQELSRRRRELLNLRRIIGPQRDVIGQLTRGDVPYVRETTRVYLRDVQDHLVRAVELIELYRELVLGARDLYLSSVNNNLNNIVKALTVITVVALPATILTSFYGQNFDVPAFQAILTSNWGFFGSMSVMVGVIAGLLYFFRRQRWI